MKNVTDNCAPARHQGQVGLDVFFPIIEYKWNKLNIAFFVFT